MIKSGLVQNFFVAEIGPGKYVVLVLLVVMFTYFRFLTKIEQEIPVSWCHGSSPGTDCKDYLLPTVVVAAVPTHCVPECRSSSTTVEDTTCVTL